MSLLFRCVACSLVAIVAVAVGCFSRAAEDPSKTDYSTELPRIAATEPAEALKTFTVAPGFRLEQVAAEPLVNSPVACEWDENGRLYVCEMRGYSENRDDKLSRISVLDDDDGDGRYDRSTVFVDGLLWPTALFPYDGGLFVADAPNVYYYRDANGDGRAENTEAERRVVLTGFGTSNVQGLLNCFRWGLDNRLHLATGANGGEIVKADAPAGTKPVNIRGRDLAIDVRTGDFVPTSGAAQHGMSFDDWGRKFVSSNSNHIQQVMYEDRYIARNPFVDAPPVRATIAADGPQAEVFRTSPVEPWRVVRTRLRVSGVVKGAVEGGGRAAGYFTGATGVTIYRGDAWPAQWHGIAVVGDVGSNLVHRKRLEPHGLEFIARRIDEKNEFVSSSDIWFRPAQFANAPDGTLYILDVCREVIEHPASIPPEIKKHLDLTHGRDRGRIYRILPEQFQPRAKPQLGKASTAELVALLEHPNAWHRETAARLLFTRQDKSAIEPLRKLAVESKSPLGRMHALYALDGLSALDAATLHQGLTDADPQVRRHAVRLAEPFLASPERLTASPALLPASMLLCGDDSLEVRYQLAFSIGELRNPTPTPTTLVPMVLARLALRDGDDPWMQAAIQSSVGDGAGRLLAALLDAAQKGTKPSLKFVEKLAAQVGRQDRAAEVELIVSLLNRLSTDDTAVSLAVVRGLSQGLKKPNSVLARMSAAGELKAMDEAVAKMLAASLAVAGDAKADVKKRLSAVDGLSVGKFAEVKPTLVRLIDTREPHEVQLAAVAVLGRYDDPSVAEVLLSAWTRLSPQLKEPAMEVLFARPERILALFDSIDAGRVPTSDLVPSRLQLLAKSKNDVIRARAEKFLATVKPGRRQDVVEAYRDTLQLAGDVDRGRTAFRKTCAVCHKVEGFGTEIGPNLATIKTRGADAILTNVLDPNREVNPLFVNYLCVTTDGRTLTGLIAAEGAASVTLKRAEGASDTVLRVDIEELQSTGLSIMPEGLEKQLDKQTLADLIAYLMQVP
jgi:putative membrane-bound dehydrogenase-like protein